MSILRLRRHGRGLGLSPRRRAAKGAAPPGIVQDGLVAEWRFDDGAGQQVTDYSGNGFHATLGQDGTVEGGEPTWASYGVDCVLNASRNWIATSSTLGISGGAARTVICVAQISHTLGPQGGGFGSWAGSGTAGERWWFAPQVNSPDVLAIITAGGQHLFTTLSPMPDQTWMFLACSMAGANINTCIGYRDGASEAATTNVALSTTGNFEIQSRGNSSGGNTWGKVAYQLVYNRALSAVEIEQNRQALKTILAGRGITLP